MSEQSEKGFSTLDFTVLPRPQLLIVRYLMRSQEATRDEIIAALSQEPVDRRPTEAQIDEALQVLCEREWLFQFEAAEGVIYSVQTRRRAAREVGKAPGQDIWGKISGDADDAIRTTSEIERKSREHHVALRGLADDVQAANAAQDSSAANESDTASSRPTDPIRDHSATDRLLQAAQEREQSRQQSSADEPEAAPDDDDAPDEADHLGRRLRSFWDRLTPGDE
ncbi:MAG: hypothetical protein JW910_17305 [Anaerolineae bacterium]|nr:hypothetical protein [Anaerolineae bacterium]